MKNLTPELIAKAKAAKTAEELFALAKDNNVELTEAEAKTYFEQLSANGAVSDDELDAVTGGANDDGCGRFKKLFEPRDKVKLLNGEKCRFCGCTTGKLTQSAGPNPYTGTAGNISIVCSRCGKPIYNSANTSTMERV